MLTLRAKIMLAMASAVAATGVSIALFATHVLGRSINREQLATVLLEARRTAEGREAAIQGLVQSFTRLTGHEALEVYGVKGNPALLLAHFQSGLADFASLGLYTGEGVLDCGLNRPGWESRDPDRALLGRAMASPGVPILDLAPDGGGGFILRLALAKFSFFDEFIGVVVAGTPLVQLTTPLANRRPGREGRFWLLDQKGRTLPAPDAPGRLTLVREDRDWLGKALAAGEAVSGEVRMERGGGEEDGLLAVVPVGHAGLAVAAFLPGREARRGLRILLQSVILASGLILCTAVILSWGLAGRLASPIRRLTEAARAVSRGDFSRTVGGGASGEIGELGRAFDAMAGDLKALTGRLEQARLYAEGILEAMGDAVMVTGPGGLVRTCNPAARILLGTPDLEGQPLNRFLPADFLQEAGEDPEPQGASPRDAETEVRRADGRRIPVLATLSPLTGHGAEVVALRDISDLKRTGQALMEALDAAEAADRAKSQFLANMSHELRTPLSGLLGMLQLARDRDGEEARHFTHMALASGNQLLTVLNDVLAFSSLAREGVRLSPSAVDIRVLLQGVRDLYCPEAARKGLAIEAETGPGLPRTLATDPARMRQALLYLVGNACKFTQQGGVIVSATLLGAGSPRPRVLFCVADTGPGIPDELLASLCRPFTQADTSHSRLHGGIGLGLVLSQGLITALGGELVLETGPAQGVLACFSLPLDQNP